MMIFFGSSSKKAEGRHHVIAASEAAPPGRPARGRTTENPKAPSAPKRQARRRHSLRPASKRKAPATHPARQPASLPVAAPPRSLSSDTFFSKICLSSNPCATGISTVVGHAVAATRPCECKCASATHHHACRGSKPHFIGIRTVVGHAIASGSREITKRTAGNRNKHPTGTSHRPCRRNQHGTGTSVATKKPNITL